MPPLSGHFLVNGLVVSVHNAIIGLGVAALCARCAIGVGLLVQLLGNLVESLLDFLGSSLDGSHVVALVDFLQLVAGSLDGSLLVSADLVAQLIQSLFGLIDDVLSVVVGVDLFLTGLVFSGVLLSLADSLVNVFLAQVGGSGDGDVGFL